MSKPPCGGPLPTSGISARACTPAVGWGDGGHGGCGGGRTVVRHKGQFLRDYVGGMLAPVARKSGWQLAEQAGHRRLDGLQHLLARLKWQPDGIRDHLQEYVPTSSAKPAAF